MRIVGWFVLLLLAGVLAAGALLMAAWTVLVLVTGGGPGGAIDTAQMTKAVAFLLLLTVIPATLAGLCGWLAWRVLAGL